MTSKVDAPAKGKSRAKWYAGAGIAVVAVLGYLALPGGSSRVAKNDTLFEVRQGPLDITVLEGGSIEAVESQEIASEVKGSTKILRIIDEGTILTQKDIEAGTLLVELDSSELQDRLTNQEIQYQSTEAGYIEAQQAYEIQLSLNESTIKAAELKAKFALMDFQEYLGAAPVADILGRLGLDKRAEQIHAAAADRAPRLTSVKPRLATEALPPPMGGEGGATARGSLTIDDELLSAIADAMSEKDMPVERDGFLTMAKERGVVNGAFTPRMLEWFDRAELDVYALAEKLGKIAPSAAQESAPAPEVTARVQMDSAYDKARSTVDFSTYASMEQLEDGQAKQQLRQLKDGLLVAREEFELARTQFEGKERLAERNFVTQTELEAERVGVSKSEIKVNSSETAERLFIRYEFPKEAERLLSGYEDALMELERTKKEAVSKLAQSEAKLRSAEAKFSIEGSQLEELRQQIAACVIRAERPGLVVYGGNDDRYGDNNRIQEGADVRQRQMIIQIPDLSAMAVSIKVHESAVNKVRRGQKARVRVDAHPEEMLMGEVMKVAVLPDSSSRWANPDLKLFTTEIRIDGEYDWLRPGMSAQVEIVVEELADVVYVPVHAVFSRESERYCYVMRNGEPVYTAVEPGSYNEEFIHIRTGLKAGEKVLLRQPDTTPLDGMVAPSADTEGESAQPAATEEAA